MKRITFCTFTRTSSLGLSFSDRPDLTSKRVRSTGWVTRWNLLRFVKHGEYAPRVLKHRASCGNRITKFKEWRFQIKNIAIDITSISRLQCKVKMGWIKWGWIKSNGERLHVNLSQLGAIFNGKKFVTFLRFDLLICCFAPSRFDYESIYPDAISSAIYLIMQFDLSTLIICLLDSVYVILPRKPGVLRSRVLLREAGNYTLRNFSERFLGRKVSKATYFDFPSRDERLRGAFIHSF